MATLNIGGRKVTVDDGFLKLSPAEQNAAVEEISTSLGVKPDAPSAPPDKYRQAAIEERDAMKAKGIDTGAGLTRRLAQGATFGGADEVMAALSTPFEMVKRGTFDPREGYNYAKARENLIVEDARKNTGLAGDIAEIGGGVVTGAGLARGGLTLAQPGMGFAGRAAAAAGEGAGYGGISGALEGEGMEGRLKGAAKGAAVGGAIGGALPVVGAGASALAAPIISNIRARINPTGVAESQFVRAVTESGRPVADLEREIAQAAAEGQGVYTAADALGNAGQRMLSGVSRSPGVGRQQVVEFLENRQAGQGRRVANALAEGFDSPLTAAQTEARMTAARDAIANAEYGAVRRDAMPVDPTSAIARIDETLAPYGVPHNIDANDSVAASLARLRSRLTDNRYVNNDFNAVQRVRGDLSDEIEQARRSGAGNKARLLGGVLRELDASLENASAGFRQANANYAQASRNIDAIEAGRNASMRGRTEDTLPAFAALTPEGQAAFRTGYVDPHIATTQGAALGVNKARPFLNDAFATEAGVMAPGNALMQRRLGRENAMFETRRQATGGSQTADNLADQAALGVDPSLIASLLHGNFVQAGTNALRSVGNGLNGNTPEVRRVLAELLLDRGASPGIGSVVQRVQDMTEGRRRVIAALMSGGLGGAGEYAAQRR